MSAHPLLHSLFLLLSFATWVTMHLALAWGLLAHKQPRWHGLVVLVPVAAWLAPYWGFRLGMKRRVVVWLSSLIAYVIALVGST